MKKLFFLSFISAALISTTSLAQGPTPSKQAAPPQFTAEQQATMVKEAKTKQIPLLVEKAGLTEAQAGKVVDINFEIRFQAGTALQGLNDADRSAKIAEFKATKEKKYSEIPLTADQIQAVYAAYESLAPKKN
ncbi:MAG TPA: hypothetical protein VMZ03_11155 [Chitinophagaceae bacterium]|nr:hypothetical protein [Chitinophagaceae bacterium]